MIRKYLFNDFKRMTESCRDSKYRISSKETSTKAVKSEQVR